jgi:xyloglucan-specific endo-beta-1,4-glucanase
MDMPPYLLSLFSPTSLGSTPTFFTIFPLVRLARIMFANLVALLSIVSLALAAPVTDLAPRSVSVDTASHCGLWDTVTAGAYSLLLDQWGTSGATGSQCAHLTSLSGSSAGATVAWSTTWKWNSASGGIKSYTNMQLNKGLNKQLKNIKSIPVSICTVNTPRWT